jgi:hypothetical protein
MVTTDDKMFEGKGNFTESHDAILQTLNANIGGDFYPVDSFEENLDGWNNIPIIYAQRHPNPKKFEENVDDALAEINGEIVGYVTSPRIEVTGHPKLLAKPTFTKKQQELNEFINSGKLSLSTGFFGSVVDGQVKNIKPQHLLVFVEEGLAVPVDRGSGFLNAKHKLDELLEGIRTIFNGAKQPEIFKEAEGEHMGEEGKPPEVKPDGQLEELKKEIDTLKARLQEADGVIAEYRKAEDEAKVEKLNAKWQEIKTALPIGMLKPEGAEEQLKKEWTDDPAGFSLKMFKNMKEAPKKEEEGEEFLNGQPVDDTIKSQRELQKLFIRSV